MTENKLPIIALVGRPNVGKSTLFNVLLKRRDALVVPTPGATRDRHYAHGRYKDFKCILVDTGGMGEADDDLDDAIIKQAQLAVAEADVLVFVVDGRQGLTATDEVLAQQLRRETKPLCLVVNKSEGVEQAMAVADFQRLGLGLPLAVAAEHRVGIEALWQHLVTLAPAAVTDLTVDTLNTTDNLSLDDDTLSHTQQSNANNGASIDAVTQHARTVIRVAMVGRPNVGKSTLINRILGEDRMVVSPLAGTTSDSIHIPYQRHDDSYLLIDTAGIRRRSKPKGALEQYSVIKSLQSIDQAHVVLAMIDAHEGIVEQDLHLLGTILESGRSLIIAVNKWDNVSEREWIRGQLERRLQFVEYAKVHFISALHGTGVGGLFNSIKQAYRSACIHMSTSQITDLLQQAVEAHPPPLVRGRRIKLRYAHMGGHNPPLIVIHGNQTDALPQSYQRYLENFYRKALRLVGTPIRIECRTQENPFKDRRNRLTPRQQYKRKRMIRAKRK